MKCDISGRIAWSYETVHTSPSAGAYPKCDIPGSVVVHELTH